MITKCPDAPGHCAVASPYDLSPGTKVTRSASNRRKRARAAARGGPDRTVDSGKPRSLTDPPPAEVGWHRCPDRYQQRGYDCLDVGGAVLGGRQEHLLGSGARTLRPALVYFKQRPDGALHDDGGVAFLGPGDPGAHHCPDVASVGEVDFPYKHGSATDRVAAHGVVAGPCCPQPELLLPVRPRLLAPTVLRWFPE
jgi:hypothetical protein